MAEIILKSEERTEAEKIMNLTKSMTQEERKDLLVFLQGIRFAKSVGKTA